MDHNPQFLWRTPLDLVAAASFNNQMGANNYVQSRQIATKGTTSGSSGSIDRSSGYGHSSSGSGYGHHSSSGIK